MTVLSGRTRGLDRMTSTSRRTTAFQQQMNGLVGILLRLIDDQGPIVLHVTAANAGEGTTTIARGLAVAAAQSSWCKVALLDASQQDDPLLLGDTIPNVLQGFDPTKKKLALAAENFGDTQIGVGALRVCGTAAPKMDQMREIYAGLRAGFTLTIIDCPPVSTMRTAVAYSNLADGVLLVVSAERTQVAQIERAQRMLGQIGATVLGVVMNHRRSRVPRLLDRLL